MEEADEEEEEEDEEDSETLGEEDTDEEDEEYDDEEGSSFHTFTIITQASSAFAATITERMPLYLSKEEEKIWLDKNSE